MAEAGASAATGETFPLADCHAQLARILNSSDFEATARGRRFLRHVVEETLAGRGSRIKAYSVAVEVFGRDASFDPQADPIVRIEAGHLRRSLERYYLTAGQSDPMVIGIPKGGYVPTFSPRSSAGVVAPVSPQGAAKQPAGTVSWARPTWLMVVLSALLGAVVVLALRMPSPTRGPAAPEVPRLLVQKFEDLSGSQASADIASGLTQDVIGHLSRFRDIVVVESLDGAPASPAVQPRYALAGSVDLSAGAFTLRVRLVNRDDGSVVWANSYDGDLKVAQVVKAQGDIARNVATTLAQTYGVIFQADASLAVADPPEDWKAYLCTLSYYAYRATLDGAALPAVRACLEEAVAHFPAYATAWGLLAQVYIDEVRFSFPYDPATSDASLQRALLTARRAVELDPFNVRGLQAEMFALFLNGEFEAARKVGERALAINPNDTELIGEYGYRLALSGSWEEGCALLTKARERNPGPLVYYESGLALCSYFGGDIRQAVTWIGKTTATKNALHHLIAAAVLAEAGERAGADRARTWLDENAPELVRNARREVERRLGRAGDAERFLSSLRKAGLDVAG